MSFSEEFLTVDLLKASCAETRGVDSFALSLIKAERQIRKLLTHLVFQYPCFTTQDDIAALKHTLAKKRVYFKGMIKGFDVIHPKMVDKLIGVKYKLLREKIDEAIQLRNKIFHGQLTGEHLSRNDFFCYVDSIAEWCRLLAEGAENEIGYDGFARNSFQKSKCGIIHENFKMQIKSIGEYEDFIKKHMK